MKVVILFWVIIIYTEKEIWINLIKMNREIIENQEKIQIKLSNIIEVKHKDQRSKLHLNWVVVIVRLQMWVIRVRVIDIVKNMIVIIKK